MSKGHVAKFVITVLHGESAKTLDAYTKKELGVYYACTCM